MGGSRIEGSPGSTIKNGTRRHTIEIWGGGGVSDRIATPYIERGPLGLYYIPLGLN